MSVDEEIIDVVDFKMQHCNLLLLGKHVSFNAELNLNPVAYTCRDYYMYFEKDLNFVILTDILVVFSSIFQLVLGTYSKEF